MTLTLTGSILDLDAHLADLIRTEHWTEAVQLGGHIDQLAATTPPALTDAALWYATLGVPVFPLEPGGKKPYPGSHGCKDATTDPAQIQAWWTAAPTSNLGIATGHVFDVIDLDGPTGVKSWASDLWDAIPPIIGRAKTRRPGGWHLYIQPTGMGNRTSMLPGVDYRGHGGYVLAPPSVVDGHLYYWAQALQLQGGAA